jgi:hypothetical protein
MLYGLMAQLFPFQEMLKRFFAALYNLSEVLYRFIASLYPLKEQNFLNANANLAWVYGQFVKTMFLNGKFLPG